MIKQHQTQVAADPRQKEGPVPTGVVETKSQPPKRFWAKAKSEAVLRLLRGENIEIVSRELGITAARLTTWREAFLAGGAESLKRRSAADTVEVRRLNEKIGEQTMEIELLREKIRRLEEREPLAFRRSRR